MKKLVFLLACVLCLSLLFTGCGKEKQTMTIPEFDQLLSRQPLAVISTQYLVQDEEHKALYPDMLQAVIQNNGTADIKNAVVAFAAWDGNGLPVKLKGQWDFSNGSYIKEVSFNSINLTAGQSYGRDSGFSLDEGLGIQKFVAIAISYETFDGKTWSNPYYDEFQTLYKGQKYNSNATVAVELEESENSTAVIAPVATAPAPAAMSAQELDAALLEQPLTITKTNYLVQDEEHKALYPDMLQVTLQNNSNTDIQSAVVAFVAWDENNLPVKVKGDFDFSGGSYYKRVNYDAINLIPGATFGESSGLELDSSCNIHTFKAIVVSYTTFEGETWDNPLLDVFREMYEGQKLN